MVYTDRIENKHKEISYNKIKRIEGTFFVTDGIEEEVHIPLHRIHLVKEEGKIIWKR